MILIQKLSACSLLSLAIFAGTAPSRGAQDAAAPVDSEGPEFVQGDVELLEARILSSKVLDKDAPLHLVEVEVSNNAPIPAEPLTFEFEVPGASSKDEATIHIVRRVNAPWAGRAGRAVPSGERLKYLLLAPVPRRQARKSEVRVISASFADAESLDDSFLEVSRKRDFIRLNNTSRREVEVILLAQVDEPEKMETLIHTRLSPRQERDIVFDEYMSPTGVMRRRPQITRIKLVDWSSIHPVDATDQLEELRAAYNSRDTWPNFWPGLSGTFEFSTHTATTRTCSGRFSYDPEGNVEVAIDTTTSSRIERDCSEFIEKAFHGLRFAKLGSNFDPSRYTLADAGPPPLIRVPITKEDGSKGAEWLWVQGGRLGGVALTEDRYGEREEWETLSTGEGWVCSGRKYFLEGEEIPVVESTWTFDELAAEPVPVRYERRERGGEDQPDIVTHLQFDALRLGLDLEFDITPPAGPVADTLRSAWEAAYRYPSGGRTISGKFDFENPGTDPVWKGRERARGKFAMQGPEGPRWSIQSLIPDRGRNNRRLDFLRDPACDRLLLYMARDFSLRPSFEKAFAGAQLEELQPGVIRVTNCRIEEVTIEEGLIASYRFHGLDGSPLRTLTYTEDRGHHLATRIQTGEEVVEIRFKAVDDGWMFPERVTLEKVFGDDWGPETLSFSKLKLSDG